MSPRFWPETKRRNEAAPGGLCEMHIGPRKQKSDGRLGTYSGLCRMISKPWKQMRSPSEWVEIEKSKDRALEHSNIELRRGKKKKERPTRRTPRSSDEEARGKVESVSWKPEEGRKTKGSNAAVRSGKAGVRRGQGSWRRRRSSGISNQAFSVEQWGRKHNRSRFETEWRRKFKKKNRNNILSGNGKRSMG